MAKSDGKAAVAAVIASAAGAPPIEQLELMPPTRSNLSSEEQARVETAIKHDRRGRPPGARNIVTREMVEFLRKTMGDPMMERWRYTMHTPETLSLAFGCTKWEALQFLDKLRADLSRFVYAQMAQVDGQGNAVAPLLTMVFPGQAAPTNDAQGKPRPPWAYIEDLKPVNAETQQNQALLAGPDDVSHGDVSHGEDK